jgi:hypothetical protein
MKKLMLFLMGGLLLSSILMSINCGPTPTQAQAVPTAVPTTPVTASVTPTVTTTATPTVTATTTPTVTATATVTATVTATPRSIYVFGTEDYDPSLMDWDLYLDTVSAGNLLDGGSNVLPFTEGSFVPQSGHSYILVFHYDSGFPPSGSDVLTAGFKYANDNSVAASGTAVGPASATVTLVVP